MEEEKKKLQLALVGIENQPPTIPHTSFYTYQNHRESVARFLIHLSHMGF